MNQDLKVENKKSEEDKKRNIIAIVVFIVFVFFVLYVFGGSTEKQASSTMNDIYKKVSADAVAQYKIAERQGDKIQICVQAGLVSAAYLQEQNESSYRNWKEIEKIDCRNAGMPK